MRRRKRYKTVVDGIKSTRKAIDEEYQQIGQAGEYAAVLAVLNDKDTVKDIGELFGLPKKSYISTVLRWLNSNSEIAENLRQAFLKHLPDFQNEANDKDAQL